MSVAIIPDFVKYQIEWLTSHDDLEFEPAIKDAIVQMLQDTGKSFIDEQAVETSQIDHIAESGRMVERTAETAQNVSDSDLVYREAAIEAIAKQMPRSYTPDGSHPADEEIFKAQEIYVDCIESIEILPAVQPEIIHCGECIYYDPPHVEKEDARYEYSEMPKEAFDVLGTGLVSVEYGINVGGRCCVDYYCKNYPDDKRVYVPKDNYCGRAERRTDE